MKDTPEHIKKIQLETWLSKSPMERLKQAMVDNAALYQFWKALQNPTQGSVDNNPSSENSLIDFQQSCFTANSGK